MNPAQFWGGAPAAPYEIEQSLRFDGSSSFTRTNGTPDSTSVTTFSCWIKKATPVITGNQQLLFYGTFPYQSYINFTTGGSSYSDNLSVLTYANSNTGYTYTNALLRDPSAWYHIVLKKNGTTVQWYINGKLQSTTQSGNNGSNTTWNGNGVAASFGSGFNGYIAEVVFVDNQDLDPTNFGEPDDNGVWRPIRYTGTFGSQGWYLKFDPSATNGIGHDHSGNGNNWTASGFTTSGTGTDVMDDTPTTNYPTLNPISVTANLPSGYTKRPPFDGNLSVTFGQGQAGIDANFGITPNSGKFYWEVRVDTDGNNVFTTRWGVLLDGSNYDIRNNQDISSVVDGDILGFALDANAGTFDYYLNGTLLNNQQTFPSTWKLAVPWMGVSSNGGRPNSQYTFNFGQRAFEQTPPTGFSALNTANLPAPDIADGSDYFQTVTYSGTGNTRDITVADNTDNAWQPDLVWIKNRDVTDHHALFDSVRGALNWIATNRTNTESAVANSLTSFNSDGFTLGSANLTNYLNQAYVSWNWLCADSFTPTSGTGNITNLSGKRNVNAGFSIVQYTGGGNYSSITHGLGVPPKVVIIKQTSGTISNGWWYTYEPNSFANDGYVELNISAGYSSGFNGIWWLNPSSTYFYLGNDTNVTGSGKEFIAYCFAEIENYSKIGHYTGNGVDEDGPFVYTGFKPAWILLKRTSSTGGSWYISDSKRNTYNAVTGRLLTNSDTSENNLNPWIDFLSNGFKIRDYDGSWNSSGGTFFYMCFAENPFGGDGVSPATAR